MEIESIFPPFIYSIVYEDNGESEYDRLFRLWNDIGYVTQFMEDNIEYLNSPNWEHTPEPESATRQVIDEATGLEDLFDELNENSRKGIIPDFDSHFKYLEGKYKYEIQWQPMKSYGTGTPSFLRMYAIKLEPPNTYIITGGGIKLADKIQNSPEIKEHILKDIDRVRDFLKSNGIFDNEDL